MTKIQHLNVGRISINGIEPTNTKVTKLTSTFNLTACFCSCPQPIDKVKIIPGSCDECWIPVECHYESCSGGNDKNRVGRYDQKDKCVILELEDRND